MAPYQATAELDDELIISIRCGGGGKHRKHAGQWVRGPELKNTDLAHSNANSLGNEDVVHHILSYILSYAITLLIESFSSK